jgi:hypothetical protein
MTEKNDQSIKAGALRTIPMGYLHEGDSFVAVRYNGNKRQVVAGVAHMDGHMVSETYGFRPHNNTHYTTPETEYINVHLDGLTYKPMLSEHWPNTGLSTAEGWTIYVGKPEYEQFLKDSDTNENLRRIRLADTLEAKMAARRALTRASLEGDIAAMEEKIQSMKTTLEGLE